MLQVVPTLVNLVDHRHVALTPKQAEFVRQYLVDRNGKQAAIRAGYSEKGAEVQASKLLRIPKVAEAVGEATAKAATKAEVELVEVLREIKRLAFSNAALTVDAGNNLLDLHKMPEDVQRAIASIEVEERWAGSGEDATPYLVKKVKLWDKGAALDKLIRFLGAYKDKLELDAGVSLRDLLEGKGK